MCRVFGYPKNQFEKWIENMLNSLLLLMGIYVYKMNWPKLTLIYVYGYLGNAKSWFLKSYHIVLLWAALPSQVDWADLVVWALLFWLPSKGQRGTILKIMILHCPSTHKHRLVLILTSSFRIWISLLEATVCCIFSKWKNHVTIQ